MTSRPYDPALHGTIWNDLIQLEYIDLGPSTTGEKDVFMGPPHCLQLALPCQSYLCRNGHSQSTGLVRYVWFFKKIMSDTRTHSKTKTLRILAKGLQTPHHYTLCYWLWSNEAIERMGKKLFHVARALLSELTKRADKLMQLFPLF